MIDFIFVFLGGGLGSAIRFLIYILLKKLSIQSYWGTLVVNIVGCFFISILYSYFEKHFFSLRYLYPLFISGLLAGFTTFSTFILDFYNLSQSNIVVSIFYLLLTVILGILAFYLGVLLCRNI